MTAGKLVPEMKQLRKDGISKRAIAKQFGVSRTSAPFYLVRPGRSSHEASSGRPTKNGEFARTATITGSPTSVHRRIRMHYRRVRRWPNVKALGGMLWALAVLGTQSLACAQQGQKAMQAAQPAQVEEIYIARSVRESRIASTEYCAEAKTGFKSTIEDQYTFRSTATRAIDGRMIDTNVKTIGSGHACFGQSVNPTTYNFYMEFLLGNAAFKGIGECLQVKADFPERGMTVVRCFLDLSDPLGRYLGGQLTTSTMWSLKLLGVDSDPPGYVQPSIATIRLWKKRAER